MEPGSSVPRIAGNRPETRATITVGRADAVREDQCRRRDRRTRSRYGRRRDTFTLHAPRGVQHAFTREHTAKGLPTSRWVSHANELQRLPLAYSSRGVGGRERSTPGMRSPFSPDCEFASHCAPPKRANHRSLLVSTVKRPEFEMRIRVGHSMGRAGWSHPVACTFSSAKGNVRSDLVLRGVRPVEMNFERSCSTIGYWNTYTSKI